MSNLSRDARAYYRKKYKKGNNSEKIIINILVVIIIIIVILYIKNKFIDIKLDPGDEEYISAFNIPERTLFLLKELSDKHGMEFSEVLAVYSLENDFFKEVYQTPLLNQIEDEFLSNYDKIKSKYKKIYPLYSKIFSDILDGLVYFPIPESFSGKFYEYTISESWGAKRTYGGERIHKGTDIMDTKNIRGYIPIVSMTDGVIENIGWNEYGGFRIGIRDSKHVYYYYAHFDSFNEKLEKGSEVKAGQLLGFMGDTGYSKKEGATGNFAVHLHIGINPETKLFKGEFWINPYPFLKLIEENKFIFN